MNRLPNYEIVFSQNEGYFLAVHGHDVAPSLRFKTFEEAQHMREQWMIEDITAGMEAEQNRKDDEEDKRGDFR